MTKVYDRPFLVLHENGSKFLVNLVVTNLPTVSKA